jgi:nucleoside-diphosphate-sugar epimerase
MRVVVVGATGNVGTALLRALAAEPTLFVTGVARRIPGRPLLAAPDVEWHSADVASSDLLPLFRGADAVVHLAWEIQPSRNLEQLHRTNVIGNENVFRAVVEARVPSLVHASSVGVYAPGPKDEPVSEDWPTSGIATSFYSVHKVLAERALDLLEREVPSLRVVRLRPALIFSRAAASEIRRLFLGPLFPAALARRELIPIVPDIPRLVFQAVHSDDVADAFRRAILSDTRGAFNVAAEPVLDPVELARIFQARRLPVPASVARGALSLSWRLRLQPTPPSWLDLARGVPLMDARRVRKELGWSPHKTGAEALLDLVLGLRERAGASTPPLLPDVSGRLRHKEIASGIGE